MDTKQLSKSIRAIEKAGEKRVEQIQQAAVACLVQCAEYGNTTYLNQLYLACRRGERDALARWALAFGNVKPNGKKDQKAAAPFVYDATKSADMEGAAAVLWESYQKEATDVARLLDEKKAIDKLIGKLLTGEGFKDAAYAKRAGQALREAMEQIRVAEQVPAESAEA